MPSRQFYICCRVTARYLYTIYFCPNNIHNCGGVHCACIDPRVARRSPKSCVAAGPVARSGSVLSSLGNALSHAATPAHGHRILGDGSGRRDTPAARAYHTLRSHYTTPSPKNTRYKPEGEGTMSPTLPRTSTIYNDDVSSGPRPRAHWYMLTHRAAATRLPTGPRIALHRVPVPPLHHYCA